MIPIPPTTKTYPGAPVSGKRLRGPRTSTSRPSWSCSCTSREPPLPSATSRVATVYAPVSSGSPHSEYCRTRPDGSTRSRWAPGDQGGRPGPSSRSWTTPSATSVRPVISSLRTAVARRFE